MIDTTTEQVQTQTRWEEETWDQDDKPKWHWKINYQYNALEQ